MKCVKCNRKIAPEEEVGMVKVYTNTRRLKHVICPKCVYRNRIKHTKVYYTFKDKRRWRDPEEEEIIKAVKDIPIPEHYM